MKHSIAPNNVRSWNELKCDDDVSNGIVKVLIANDEQFQLDLMCLTFKSKFNICPVAVMNGKEALEKVFENI